MKTSRARRRDGGRQYTTAFFVLAIAFSWAWLVPMALARTTVVAGKGWPTHVPALFGPLLAAVVVTARRDGRHGLAAFGRRLVRLRAPVRWWLVALSPVLLLPLVLAVDVITGRPLPALQDFAVFTGLPATWGVLGVAAAILAMGVGEEAGWRGYAQSALQRRHPPLAATTIVAAGWALWHAPMFFTLSSFRGFTPATTLGWLVGLYCGAVVLTWLYQRSGGSIALVACWHAGYNLVSGARAGGLLAATSTTLVVITALVLVGWELRNRRRGLPSVLDPTGTEPRTPTGTAAADLDSTVLDRR